MSSIEHLVARARGLVLLLVPLLVWACGDESNPEAPSTPTVVSLTFDVDGDLSDALGAADNAWVRIAFDGQQPVEKTVEYTAGTGIDIDLAGGGNALVTVELRSGTSALFRGSKHVSISGSQTNSVSFAMTPKVSDLRIEAMESIDMLGEAIQLEATALFVTGEAIPGVELVWSTSAENVELAADGAFRAFRNGTYAVTVTAGELTATGEVEVEAEAELTGVSPAVVALGEPVTLELEGHNLFGATGVEVCGTATVDAESLAVAEDGKSATVAVRWERYGSGSEALQSGAHCVKLETPQGLGEVEVQLNEPTISQLVTSADVMELEKGETYQIELHVFDDQGTELMGQPVQWESSAPTTISVDQTGMVEAIRGGSATITATVLNASITVDVFVNALGGGTATLSGTVATTSTTPGVPVEGAMVAAVGHTGSAVVATDENGDYTFENLPEGSYEVMLADMPAGFADATGEIRKTYLEQGESDTMDFAAITVVTVSSAAASGSGSLSSAFDMINDDNTIGGIEIEPGLDYLMLDPGALFYLGQQDITVIGNGATIDASGCWCVPMVFMGGGSVRVRDLTVMGSSGNAEAGLVFTSWGHQGGDADFHLKNVSVQNMAAYGLVFLDIDIAGPLSTAGGFSSLMSSMIGYEEAQLNVAPDPESPRAEEYQPQMDTRISFTQPNLTIGTGVGLDITLDNVHADGNASLAGTAGTVIVELGPGDIMLTAANSSFSRNGSFGLQIVEEGSGDVHAVIDNSVLDNNGYGFTGGGGLQFLELEDGNMTFSLSNSMISRSNDDGADITETGDGYLDLTTTQNEFFANSGDGFMAYEYDYGDFMVESNGDVVRNNNSDGFNFYEYSDGHFTANVMNGSFMNNDDDGIELTEYDDDGMTVMMSNVEVRHTNDDGINIYSQDDDDLSVTLVDVIASQSADDGIDIYGEYDYFDVFVSLTNVTANDNEEDGVDISTYENDRLDVVLNNVWANNNGDEGFDFDTEDNDEDTSVTGANVWANNSRGEEGFDVYVDEEDLLFDVDNLHIDGTVTEEGLYLYVDDGDLVLMLQGAMIANSEESGIQLYAEDDIDGEIRDSQIRDNRDFGLYISGSDGGTLTLINTVISGNTPADVQNSGGGVIN